MENWKNISSILNAYNEDIEDKNNKLYQIYEFIEDNNKKGIVKILKTGININSEYDDSTPLIKCIQHDKYNLAEFFIKYCNANPNYRETKKEGALWYSLREQKINFLTLFLEQKPKLIRGNNNQIMLIEATKLSNVDIVELLLSNKNVKVNEKDGFGNTALHYALAKNPMTEQDVEISRLLLAAGADQSSMNVSGETPGKFNEDSMANSVLHEHNLIKKIQEKEQLQLDKEFELQAQLDNDVEYEEVIELDPVTNQPKPVLRPKPKPQPRPLPKPTPDHVRRKI